MIRPFGKQLLEMALVATCALVAVGLTSSRAQELPPQPKPTPEHAWLDKFVGVWTVKSKGVTGEGQPPIETTGTIRSKRLGKFWLLNTMEGTVAGTTFRGLQTIGYDSRKKQFVATWVDSTNDYMWQYRGKLDRSRNKLVLEAEGPHMADPGKTAFYRDSYEFTSDNEMVVESSMKMPDGTWFVFMRGAAKKK